MKQIILFLLVLLPVCAFAQFTETFDGPEVDSKNPWKGDLDKFVISNGKLVFDGTGLADTFYLHLPISYASTMEWEMDVSFAFKPSNVNKTCIYIYRTGQPSDLIYYIQVGSNNDNVSLYEYPPKGKPKAIITGERKIDGRVAHIRLTLEDHKYWTLYTRFGNEKEYQIEKKPVAREIQDALDNGSLNISCICKSTSNKYKDRFYYIDNINIRHELSETTLIPDGEPDDPDIPSTDMPFPDVEIVNLSELRFTFDSPVDISNAKIIISEIGEANHLIYGDNKTVVSAVFPDNLIPARTYTLSFTGFTDLSGNLLNLPSQDFALEDDEENNNEEEITPSSILINEIMAKPGDGPFFEYVELYNPTSSSVSLKGLELLCGTRSFVLPDVDLLSNKYALLPVNEQQIDFDLDGIVIPIDKYYPLKDGGQTLILKSSSGTIIDEYTYAKAKPAQSWERSSSGSWHLSSDPRGGTPGSANSSGKKEDDNDPEKPDDSEQPNDPVKPDDPDKPDNPDHPVVPDDPDEPTIPVEPLELVINELLPNPFVGGSEYIELYNRSDHALPLSGLVVATRKTDGTLSTRYPLSSVGTMIEPGGYAVLTKSKAGVADFYTIQSPASLFEIAKLPILANTSSTLVLFRASDGTVIDEVAYSSKWHASSVKNQKGVALERIDPEAETQRPANWTSAAASAGYGTPGYRNSQSDNPSPDEPDTPTGIEAPEWLPGSDNYKISYYLDQPGYNCRAFVYNTAGQRVAQIANHELLGLSGQFIWDGSSLSGNRLRTGVYIFYAEIYHTNGQIKTYKKVFLVR